MSMNVPGVKGEPLRLQRHRDSPSVKEGERRITAIGWRVSIYESGGDVRPILRVSRRSAI